MRKFWMNDKIYNLELIQQRMSTKDFKLTAQSEHLLRLLNLSQELDKNISAMIVEYTVYSYSINGD